MPVRLLHVRRLGGLALLLGSTATLALHAQAPHALTDSESAHINDLIGKMTLAEKLDYIGGTGFAIRAVPSVHLPALEMSDGPFGTRSNAGFPSTTYAAGVGLAASWDPSLAARVGEGIGRDARARGVHFMLGPGVNIYRSPRNGRNFEYFGEDPFLTSQIALGYIIGMQKTGVSATIKHYIANNSEYLRHDSDSIVDQRALHEIYLPSFETAVKRGNVGAIMDSYNLINGEHATQNGYLNIEVLRKDFGFTGTLMSDWLATYDGVAAANGGLDLEMPSGKFMNRKILEPAIKAGTVTEATINEKIRHILTTASEFGWLSESDAVSGARNSFEDSSISVLDAANNQAALDSARESPVLLKNAGSLLPLDKSAIKTVLVVGPDAYPGVPVGGGSAGVIPFHLVSPLEGLSTYAGNSGMKVLYDRGLPTMADFARATTFTTPAGKPGLTLETFAENDTLSGTPTSTTTVANLVAKGLTIEDVVSDAAIMDSLLNGDAPKLKPSRRWTGVYTASADADYIVALEGSGEGSGNRVSLDGKQIIDNWDLVRATQPTLTLHLAAGPHTVVIEDRVGSLLGGHLTFGIAPAATIVAPHAVQLARLADVVVVETGFDHASETEGGDRTFSLPFGQDQLISAMVAANPKTIVTVTSGGNVDSTAWLDKVPAYLETWYAGQAGGTALAEILFGDVNPSGHLPFTEERRAEDNPTFANYYPDPGTKKVLYKEGIFVGYRGYEHNHTTPLFPFGYGLSYTTFKFSDLKVAPAMSGATPDTPALGIKPPTPLYTATFSVTNTGSRKGATVAQLYLSDDHLKLPHADRQLKGFERVDLAPGETKQVTLTLDPRAFAFYDTISKKWTIDPGKFTVLVGDSVIKTPLHADLTVDKAQVQSAGEPTL